MPAEGSSSRVGWIFRSPPGLRAGAELRHAGL